MDASNLRRPTQLQRGDLHCGGCDRKEAANLRNVGQSEPPGGFICSFMRALLHVLDRGREFPVVSSLSNALAHGVAAWRDVPPQLDDAYLPVRLGRADGSGGPDREIGR